MGVLAGYLVWSERIGNQPQAVALVEHVVGHAMGEPGPRAALGAGRHAVARTGAVSDRIEIRDLRVTGTHGVLPEERDRAQPFSVDIVAWVDMEAAQQSDDLADTVDYGALAQAAADVVAGRSYRLLEALAGRLASALLIRRPPARGGRGHGAQAAPAAGARCGLDRGQGAARPLMAAPAPPPWRAFIGLGSNLGDRRALLRQAVEGLRRRGRRRRRLPALRDRSRRRARRARAPTSTWWWSCRRPTPPGRCSSGAAPSRRRPGGCARCAGAPDPRCRRPLGRGVAGGRGGPHRPAPPPVGAALRGAAPGRPGPRPRDIGRSSGPLVGGRRCG